ncbi:MAG: YajQ family cyclic di-GMP-binding protein [Cyanobacteria bacterium]|jgi:uncharacterized protein YajQ (UPF0234 family)|nr:YajQ family cyclic di-GMP-binding protein [Cyanobacteria bacterium GSL.Bin1]
MASNYTFDIVSDFDHQEMLNAVDQTRREIENRYDLKDTQTSLELTEDAITVNTDSEFTLNTVHDILRNKAAKRKLSQKIFEYGTVESASGNRVRQIITLKRGIDKELAKEITKKIKNEFKKVQPSIQGDSVRVSSKSKDDLQEVIQSLKETDYPVPLQITNYR